MSTRLDPLIPARAQPGFPPPTTPTAPAAPQIRRKPKPAKRSKAMALGLSVLTAAGLAAQFAHQQQVTAGNEALVTRTAATAPGVPTTAVPTTPATTAAATGAGAAAASTIANGTYTGQAFTNRWGVVQVQAVYSNGKLTDVQILSSPDGERKSVSINQRALPTLIANSISAQSAKVNTVSGATYTSVSYRQSLQSAIDQATAASS